MEETSRLIQPLICTQAMSTLKTVMPRSTAHRRVDPASDASRHFTTAGLLSYRQVLQTSLPLLFADLAALVGCYLLGTIVTKSVLQVPIYYPGLWNNLTALCLCHFMLGSVLGLFPASGINPVRELRNQITAISGSFLVLIALNGLLGVVTTNEVLTIVMAFPLVLIVGPSSRFTARRACARSRWWGERVIILGSGRQGKLVHQFLERMPQRGLKPLGVVDESADDYWMSETEQPLEFLGITSELVSVCRRNDCHWVIAALGDKTEEEVRRILAEGSLIPNLVVLNSNMMTPTLWVDSFEAAGLTGIHIRDRMLQPFQRVFKRFVDIVLAGILLVVTAPLFLLLLIWSRICSKGPVFYCHQRVGRFGKLFGVWKFTTMVADASSVLKEYLATNPAAKREWETFHKLKNDPRVIPGYGHFLRRTSLDELPQLLNVLIGEMSMVGPRPVYTKDEIEMYGELYPLYMRVLPGLSGLWQVSGRNNTTFADKVCMDTYYVMNWSLWLDYFILLRTVRTVLFREGSY